LKHVSGSVAHLKSGASGINGADPMSRRNTTFVKHKLPPKEETKKQPTLHSSKLSSIQASKKPVIPSERKPSGAFSSAKASTHSVAVDKKPTPP